MRRQQLGRCAVELNLLVDADVNLREVLLVEARLQHLAVNKNLLFLQFVLRTKHEPSRVQLLVLLQDGLGTLVGLRRQFLHVAVQVGHLLIQVHNLDFLLVQLCTQCLHLLLLLLHLLSHRLHQFAQSIALDAALTQLLLQLIDEFLVLFHRTLDKLDVLTDTLLRTGALTLLGDGHTILCLGNLTETFLNLTKGSQHVVNLVVLLADNLLQRVNTLGSSNLCL